MQVSTAYDRKAEGLVGYADSDWSSNDPKTRRFISSFHVSQCSCHTLNPDNVGFNQGRGKISRPAKPDGGISGPMKKELTWRKRITRA